MRSKERLFKTARQLLAIVFWLFVWHMGAKMLGQEILLVSPARAFSTLISLMGTVNFYESVFFSLSRVLLGFGLALIIGVMLGAAAKFSPFIRAFAQPLMQAAKATPVASFTILALIWIKSANLSIFTSFLMGLPVF